MALLKSLPRFFATQSTLIRSLKNPVVRPGEYIYVVSSGYKWNPKSVIINLGHKERFMFNCGPGTSRTTVEHKKVARELQALFITRPVWENVGGIPAFLLKLKDFAVSKITVHGFDHILNMCEACQPLGKPIRLKLEIGNAEYVHKNVKISNVKLMPTFPVSQEISEHSKRSLQKCSRKSNDNLGEQVLAYIISKRYSKPIQATHLVERGIPPGPLAVNLLRGHSVTLPDGQVVHPEDFMLNREKRILVIDCPSEAYIPSMEESEAIRNCQTANEKVDTVIIHFSPAAVMKQPRYIQWMKGFSPSTTHLIVNDSNLTDSLITSRYRQALLSQVHPGVFPPLKDTGFYWLPSAMYLKDTSNLIHGQTRPFSAGDTTDASSAMENNPVFSGPVAEKGSSEWLSQWHHLKDLNVYEGRPGTKVTLHPLAVTRDEEIYLDGFTFLEAFQSTLPENSLRSIHEKLENAGMDMSEPATVQADFENMYPRVVFLGTGAKTDSKERNVSGILLRLNPDSNMIVDCGDGTHGQIHRLYGDKASDIFRSLKAVYISHLHGDHHFGLIDLLREREKAFGNEQIPPLVLFAPSIIDSWLGFIRKVCYRFSLIAFVPLHTMTDEVEVKDENFQEIWKYMLSKTGFTNVRTVRVPHCRESYGVTFEHSDGWKISYSGDTSFSYSQVKMGENSDVLIHEATYDEDDILLAQRNHHSTVNEALQVGQRMNAKFTILTHLSQRYFLIPRQYSLSRKDFTFAFDFMQIPLHKCNYLPIFHELYTNMNEAYSKNRLHKFDD